MEDDKTTTGTVADDTGAETALPEHQQDDTAAQVSQDQGGHEQQTTGEETSTPDDKLKRFAQSHGFELDSPNAIKAAKVAMDNQAEYQRNRQKASELEKTVQKTSDDYAEQVAAQTGQDPELLKRLQRMEVKAAVNDFWNQPGVDRALEPAMVELVQQKPHLAGDLEALYALAAQKSGSQKAAGGKEALESLASKQRVAAPAGSAVNSHIEKKQDDPFLRGLTT